MFAIVGQQSSEGRCDHGSYTQTISFVPGTVHAQVSLFHVAMYDEHLSHAKSFILGYTHRPVVDGLDESVQLAPDVGSASASVVGVVDRMTGVTWGLRSSVSPQGGSSPIVWGRIDIFWWGDVGTGADGVAGGTRTIQLEPGTAAVVHGKQDGKIRHIHEEIALAGAQPPDPVQVERRALALDESGEDVAELGTLIAPARQLRRDRTMRVDVELHKLVVSG